MLQNKKSYYQGTEEPTPKKQKYKPEKAIRVQPRFKEPLFKNYDLYETEGVDGPAKHGPGTGLYQHMNEYKSVKDFIDKSRNKNKYKAQDSWIEGSKEKRKKKASRRLALLSVLLKQAIDFPIDEQLTENPILGDSGTLSDSIPIGGQLDEYLPLNDFEGKMPTELDFGRDYTDDNFDEVYLNHLINKYLNPSENSLYGLPDGISPKEDLDADSTISNRNIDYGTTDSGNTLYEKMWFV